jgi:demethylmenaquinone methyltransferase/2-methoxy-6-polyprenyl-1,4-benzoquinol methylase
MLSRGAIDAVYQRVGELAAAPGARVLDVGCGTGNLSCACAARGADVVAVDSNAGMLDVARRKAAALDGPGRIELVQLDAMELEDRFEAASFDAAVSCLLFSELEVEERAYVLETLRTRVRPGGVVVIADEVAPESVGARAWWSLTRAPLVAVTWLLTQTTTHAVGGLSEMLEAAGFVQARSERMKGSFLIAIARVPEEATC